MTLDGVAALDGPDELAGLVGPKANGLAVLDGPDEPRVGPAGPLDGPK